MASSDINLSAFSQLENWRQKAFLGGIKTWEKQRPQVDRWSGADVWMLWSWAITVKNNQNEIVLFPSNRKGCWQRETSFKCEQHHAEKVGPEENRGFRRCDDMKRSAKWAWKVKENRLRWMPAPAVGEGFSKRVRKEAKLWGRSRHQGSGICSC